MSSASITTNSKVKSKKHKAGVGAVTMFNFWNGAFLTILVLLILVPIVKVIVDSFDGMASETVFRWLPGRFTVDAYENIVSRPTLRDPFMVSLYMTIAGTFLSMVVSSLMAYALAQPKLPGKSVFLGMALLTMVFRAGMIPLFLVVRNLGLMNTQAAVLAVHMVDAYYLLLLTNFFRTIPSSILDAAKIDGCSPFRVFWQIVLPLSKPGLAAIGLFYLVYYWNQWFEYILFIQRYPKLHNFQVFLRSLVIEGEGQGFTGYSISIQSLRNASVVVSIIPVLIVYPFVQKHFVKGINLGAVKG